MKYVICFSLLVFTVGCGRCERVVTHLTGNLTYKCSDKGVEYVQSDSGLAVSYDRNGQVVKCK